MFACVAMDLLRCRFFGKNRYCYEIYDLFYQGFVGDVELSWSKKQDRNRKELNLRPILMGRSEGSFYGKFVGRRQPFGCLIRKD